MYPTTIAFNIYLSYFVKNVAILSRFDRYGHFFFYNKIRKSLATNSLQ